ncbi:YqhA family protein [Tessaracoccus sp. OS52]|uniref:YqhA family protein n=1 Tax=unclassified Tessaracoccus TaxID=2635419 RepID=UPI00117D9516|nr:MULTISPECIES: YqhA family protein [unclassified Tessaracoccus]MCC2594003.1 YqhA family protein [Tessaracoccus sp. OS52]
MNTEPTHRDEAEAPGVGPSMRGAGAMKRGLELFRYIAAIGAVTALLLSVTTYLWALSKALLFVETLLTASTNPDAALVKLYESVDSILIATVMLIVGYGLWELFVGDLNLPPSLTTLSFDHLKGRTAGTLLLVIVVRFLEVLVARPEPDELLAVGLSVTLIGALLFAFSNWHRPQ